MFYRLFYPQISAYILSAPAHHAVMRCFGHLLIRAHSQPASAFPYAKAGMMPARRENCIFSNVGLGEGSALPVGVPVPYPLATPPTGWMKCNGSSFNKTLLPALAAVYPSGVLPDLRGEFIRGWDDGRGVDSGRKLMSAQEDAIRNISGTVRIVSNSYNQNTARQMTGVFGWSESSAGDTTNFVLTAASNTSGYKNGGFTFDASSQVPTALENRPRNIAFNYIVRTA